MTSAAIRQSFLDFFRSKQHTIVPSSSLMPDAPNLLFTNAGMNQFVPIFLGQRAPDVDRWAGAVPGLATRAADTQKCIRAGGKHNDLEDVGLDTYHHTFFEMLGNWSFGDYFKREAIDWAWELVTGVWQFPKERLYATVYKPGPGDPSEVDQEAWDLWAAKFRGAGLDPAVHIVFGNKQDNFWMMGDTGPCGPCSELHMDLTPAGDTKGALVNQGDARCIEIWNLVFIQFNANPDGAFSPLPARHVDTGMGFERVASILQGTKDFTDFAHAQISNYETDIFRPIFDAIERLSGKRYGSTLPQPGSAGETEQERIDVAFRVIADHIRTLGFAIADGIQPGNTDRNYVLRRILRRAVRYGRTLGFHEPFFHKLVGVLADTMGDVFPEIRSKRTQVEAVIRIEEEAFNKTLDRGIRLFEEAVEFSEFIAGRASSTRKSGTMDDRDGSGQRQASEVASVRKLPDGSVERELTADFAFQLYDTYGFPLDLTELMARERGMKVDVEGFERLMEEQRERARKAQKKEVIELSEIDVDAPTRFVGFETLEATARVIEVVRVKERSAVILDVSPCYAEMGGQVGDTGTIASGAREWRVANTQKSGETWLHLLGEERTPNAEHGIPDGERRTATGEQRIEDAEARAARMEPPEVGAEVTLSVDVARRRAIERHHTVTHLLHWALHEVVSRDAAQKGSYVGPEKLTFDFNSAPLTPQQVTDIERLVNERILENATVSWTEVPYAEVRSRKEIMQFFGEKYGDRVRVVQIGGSPTALDGYSMELCGGTHTRATGEIGLFRVVAENAIASGVRRIEAVAGLEAYRRAGEDLQLIRTIAARVNSPVGELDRKIESLLAQQKDLERLLKAMEQKQAAATARALLVKAVSIGGIPAIIERVDSVDGDTLQSMVNELKSRFDGVVLLGGVSGGAVALVASVGAAFTGKVQAGKLIQQIAPLVGGKGGGRPDNARGGGKDPLGLDPALDKARSVIGAL
jgi:alanyl-tRNA synthetase